MTTQEKFKVLSIIREVFGNVEVSFSEHPNLNSAYIKTKHVMCKFSTYKKIERKMQTSGFYIFDIIGSPMPAMNNYVSYQIDFTVCY